jgi:hypothetical protein
MPQLPLLVVKDDSIFSSPALSEGEKKLTLAKAKARAAENSETFHRAILTDNFIYTFRHFFLKMRCMTASGRKAYFYSLDAFIAIIILTVGIFLVLQSGSHQAPRQSVFLLSRDLTDYLAGTRVYDLNDELYNDSIKLWKENGNISHIDNTLLEQAGEFYARNETALASSFLSNVTVTTVTARYNFEIVIDGTPIFGSSVIDRRNATNLVANKVMIFGVLNSTASWGPYEADIRVWQ